jgi:uncharacterized delta-60 repeat protein
MNSGTPLHRAWLLVFSILLVASTPAAAQAGQLDPTFGTGGIVTTDFGNIFQSTNTATATAVTIQSDGKIVVCGGVPASNGFATTAVVRYNIDGSLDNAFGNAGIAVTPNQLNTPSSIALQSDGKIVVAGAFNQITVIRYNSNGQLDSTFGTNGVVTTGFLGGDNNKTSGVVLQPDGKILVAGAKTLLRLLTNGQIDPNFGSGNGAKVAGYDPTALALLPNGKMLVASALISSGFQNPGFVTRYNPDGSLDPSFGINGQLSVPGPANAMVLLDAGRFAGEFLIGGDLTSSVTGPVLGFAVSGYQAVGVVDARFGTHGGVVTPIPNSPAIATSGLGVQSSGDIVTLGTASSNYTSYVFALARYTPAGRLDTTFGSEGIVTTSFPNTNQVIANGLAIQSDDKIVAVGNYEAGQDDTGFKLARYLGH